jgi:hypothetical protein
MIHNEKAKMDDRPQKKESSAPVYCAFDEMVAVERLVPNPRNPNTHPDEQVRLLAKMIMSHGWRCPITVSKRSGFVIRGHGRLAAAMAAGLEQVPVDYQDYQSEADEWADLIADNRISELSEIHIPTLKDVLEDLNTSSIDIELTGFTNDAFENLMSELKIAPDLSGEKGGVSANECPKCGYTW